MDFIGDELHFHNYPIAQLQFPCVTRSDFTRDRRAYFTRCVWCSIKVLKVIDCTEVQASTVRAALPTKEWAQRVRQLLGAPQGVGIIVSFTPRSH